MNSLFSRKPKKPLKSSQQALFWGIPTNIAAGPLGFRADLGPRDEKSKRALRVVFRDKESEGQGLPAPGLLPSERGNDPSKKTGGNLEGEKESSEASKVVKRDCKNTALGGAVILLGVAKEAADGFGPLKAVLSAISAIYSNYEEAVAVKKKIEGLRSSTAALEVIFVTPIGDIAEQRRRDQLLREFDRIEVRLRLLSEKSGVQRFLDHVQDGEEVSDLLEDVQETICNYRMVQQMMIYEQGCELIDAAEACVLNNIRCAYAAEYRHGDRKGCLKGTRGAVLDEIELWTSDFDKQPVYWLNGLAGTGKSTISQTVAERVFADGQLGASFFCSRDFEDKRNLRLIFPTLAVQLAHRYTQFRSIFVPLVRSDPGVVQESLYNQMKKLIVGPLKKSDISTVIMIDALDECKDEEPASAILSVLGQFVSEIPKVKFFLTGRPEPRIREGFRLPLLAKVTDVLVLHNVEPDLVKNDIRRFLKCGFLEIAGRWSGLDDWPTEDQLDHLCDRAAGLFVYAVATVKFIDHGYNNPRQRLDRLLRSPESSAHEGKTKFKSNTTLDSLYMSILQEAFGGGDPEDDPKIRSVLGAVIFASNPLSPTTIAALLGFDTEGVLRILSLVHSLLILQEDPNLPVRAFHKSFPDFIVEPARCTDRRFHIPPPDHHSELLVGCLGLMGRRLERNVCKLPDAVTNVEVGDLEKRAERYVDHSLRYACRSWYKHLVDPHTTPPRVLEITSILHQFLEGRFLFWLEALSVLSAVRDAIDALEVAAKWLEAPLTLNLVRDCFRFVTGFFEVISTSAPHTYHSALLLSPQTSIVRKLYKSYIHPFARVVRGLPTSWEPIVATIYHRALIATAAWSPCGRFIAVAWLSSTTIDILDAITLERLNTFDTPQDRVEWIGFSPDTCMLTRFSSEREITSWDLQTGGPVGAIPSESHGSPGQCFASTYSPDGKMVAVAYGDLADTTTTAISTYNLISRTHVYSHQVSEGRIVAPIWTRGQCLRFVAVKPGSITVWEVEFALIHTLVEVESLPAPDDVNCSEGSLFLPALSRLAFTLHGAVLVWDAQDSRILLNFPGANQSTRMSFSPDGRFFACGTIGLGVYLWKDSPLGYTLHQTVISSVRGVISPLISPSGGSIVVLSHSAIQLWHTANPILSAPSVPTRSVDRANSILEFSPDETLAAVARLRETTATVLDLKSGDPRLTVNAGMEILGLRVTRSAIVVIGEGKVVTWDLPAEDCGPNATVNVKDSIRTAKLHYSPHPHPPLVSYTSISPDFSRVATVWDTKGGSEGLNIYDASTGKYLVGTTTTKQGYMPWFTLDGREVWCVEGQSAEGWTIVEDGESGVVKLEPQAPTALPSGGFPWRSPLGYEVTTDGWVLSPGGKRLLWLPDHWRSDETYRAWGGQFIGLLHRGLQEAVILELDE